MNMMKLKHLMVATATSLILIASNSAIAEPPAYPGANGQPFQALQAQIDALIASTDDVLAQINANLQDLQDQIDAATGRITELELYRDSLELRLAELESDVEANADAIADLETELAQVNADIAALTTEVNKKQDLITGYCPSGYSIRQVYSNGSVACEADHDAQLITSYRAYNSIEIPTGETRYLYSPTCNSNYRATGGGFTQSSFDIQVTDSYPSSSNTQWAGYGWNRGTSNQTLYIYVVCTATNPVDYSRAP